jgi:PIN domain nuclease of toxin-antitoxin system
MIILDTHVWVWWAHQDSRLTNSQAKTIQANETNVIGVSAISAWEVAKLVEYNRPELPYSLQQWFDEALNYPGISLTALIPQIAVESSQLPGEFHRDPADQIIVATARIYGCPIVTSVSKIQKYPHVKTVR